jgi:hypothetical protein
MADASTGPANDPQGLAGVAVAGGSTGVAVPSGAVVGASGLNGVGVLPVPAGNPALGSAGKGNADELQAIPTSNKLQARSIRAGGQ